MPLCARRCRLAILYNNMVVSPHHASMRANLNPDYPMTSVRKLLVVIAGLLPLLVWSPAGAQDCRDMPDGLAKRQCAEAKNPEAFQRCAGVPWGAAKRQCVNGNGPGDGPGVRAAKAARTCTEMLAICNHGMDRVAPSNVHDQFVLGGDPCTKAFQGCLTTGTWYGSPGPYSKHMVLPGLAKE